jgi:hypothetical protein
MRTSLGPLGLETLARGADGAYASTARCMRVLVCLGSPCDSSRDTYTYARMCVCVYANMAFLATLQEII